MLFNWLGLWQRFKIDKQAQFISKHKFKWSTEGTWCEPHETHEIGNFMCISSWKLQCALTNKVRGSICQPIKLCEYRKQSDKQSIPFEYRFECIHYAKIDCKWCENRYATLNSSSGATPRILHSWTVQILYTTEIIKYIKCQMLFLITRICWDNLFLCPRQRESEK